MVDLNWAYELLNDEDALRKWEEEASDEEIRSTSTFKIKDRKGKGRYSDIFRGKREFYQLLISTIETKNGKVPKLPNDFKSEQLSNMPEVYQLLPETEWEELYMLSDGTKFSDIYALVAYKNKHLISESNRDLQSWTIDESIIMLKRFLMGKLYGSAFKDVVSALGKFCETKRKDQRYDFIIYQSVYNILSSTESDTKRVYKSLNDISHFFVSYSNASLNKTCYLELLDNKYFRCFFCICIE